MFATYAEARAAVDAINNRFFAEMENGRSLRIGVSSEAEFTAHFDAKVAIGKEARAAGFSSVASGGFCLNSVQRKLR